MADPAFIETVYKTLQSDGVSTGGTGPAPVQIEVDNDFDVQLNIKAKKTKMMEGEAVEVKISLTGEGAAGGISKDLWVFITTAKSSPGAGALPDDIKRLNDANVEVRDENGMVQADAFETSLKINESGKGTMKAANGFWIKIAKGQKSSTVLIDTVGEKLTYNFRNSIVNNDNSDSSIIVSISNYAVVYMENSKGRIYKDGTTLNSSNHLMSGAANISTVVDVIDQGLLISSRYDQFYVRDSETGQTGSTFDSSGRAHWKVFLDTTKNHIVALSADHKSSFHLIASVLRDAVEVMIGDFVVADKIAQKFTIDKALLKDTDGSITLTDANAPSLSSSSTPWTIALDGALASASQSPHLSPQLATPTLVAASARNAVGSGQSLADMIAPAPADYLTFSASGHAAITVMPYNDWLIPGTGTAPGDLLSADRNSSHGDLTSSLSGNSFG